MNYQLKLDENWMSPPVVSIFTDADMIECSIHGWWCPNAYYNPEKLREMLFEQGSIECPMCLADIAGGEIYLQ